MSRFIFHVLIPYSIGIALGAFVVTPWLKANGWLP